MDNADLPNKSVFQFYYSVHIAKRIASNTEILQDDLLFLPKTLGKWKIGAGWPFLLATCTDLIKWTEPCDKSSTRARVIHVSLSVNLDP